MYFELTILLVQTILFGAVIVFLSYWLTRTISADLDAPYYPTSHEILPMIVHALDITPGDVVYDLGCGDGRLLFYGAKHFPEARFIGIERNLLLVLYMRVKKFLLKADNVEIRRENIFQSDISDATRIYAFLLRTTTIKFFEAKNISGVRVVSRAFEIPGKTPEKIFRVSPHDDKFNKHMAYVYNL